MPFDVLPPGTNRPEIQWRLPFLLSGAAASAFVIFGAMAASRFPRGYGPWYNDTLSELGNPLLNPNGYGFYLVGCAVAGVFAMISFIMLGHWRASGTHTQNRFLLLVQVLGVLGGLGLFMNAVFPENQLTMHHFWAGLLFNCFAAAAPLSIPALWRTGPWNGGLIALGIMGFASVIVMFVFASVHWVEWIPISMFVLFPLLLSGLSRTLKPGSRITG